MAIAIKPFNILNIEEAYQFLLDTFRISFGDETSQWPNNLANYSFEQYRAAFAKMLKSDRDAIFSVWDDERLAGQIELKFSSKEPAAGYVSLFYLSPEYRNRGLGSQLEQHAISVFKEKGLLKAKLSVSERNLIAIKFYKKCGWKNLGPAPERPMGLTMEKTFFSEFT